MIVKISWTDGRAFLAALDGNRYVVATELAEAHIGDRIVVELEFLDSGRMFRHHARVVDIDAGLVTFEFAPEEPEVREMIVLSARGESVPYLSRRVERFAVEVPVEVQIGLFWRRGVALELAELGMFVEIETQPQTDRVAVRLGGLELAGHVIYREAKGFALEFAFADRADEVRVRNAVRDALQSTKRS